LKKGSKGCDTHRRCLVENFRIKEEGWKKGGCRRERPISREGKTKKRRAESIIYFSKERKCRRKGCDPGQVFLCPTGRGKILLGGKQKCRNSQSQTNRGIIKKRGQKKGAVDTGENGTTNHLLENLRRELRG